MNFYCFSHFQITFGRRASEYLQQNNAETLFFSFCTVLIYTDLPFHPQQYLLRKSPMFCAPHPSAYKGKEYPRRYFESTPDSRTNATRPVLATCNENSEDYVSRNSKRKCEFTWILFTNLTNAIRL